MTADLAAERTIMVDSQVRPQDVTDLAIQDAMRAAPRETVVPQGKLWLAYADAEVEYAPGRWLLRPRDVAKLLHGLRPRAGETALAIASPYAALVLETMGLKVTRLDGPDLLTVTGSWPLIVCEGAVEKAPQSWLDALAPGGRLGLIERNGRAGSAVSYSRAEGGVGSRALFSCAPPYLGGFEPKTSFVF
jgi:protein-L-isoaspartate(D-aspartate) O-methyltransferase